MGNDKITLLVLAAVVFSLLACGMSYTSLTEAEHAAYLSGRVNTWKIIDDTIKDEDFNQTDVKFLNYSAAGTYTADKTIVCNGSAVTGSLAVEEGGLTTINYITATVTNNRSCVASIDALSTNTFNIVVNDVINTSISGESVQVNWTAYGS